MKNIIFVLLVLPFMAMTSAPNFGTIGKALSSGNVATIIQYCDANLDIAILDEEKTYTKADAKDLLDRFFAKYQPKSFDMGHEGTSKSKGAYYCIGGLKTSNKNFRVFIYAKGEGKDFVIQELRFEEE